MFHVYVRVCGYRSYFLTFFIRYNVPRIWLLCLFSTIVADFLFLEGRRGFFCVTLRGCPFSVFSEYSFVSFLGRTIGDSLAFGSAVGACVYGKVRYIFRYHGYVVWPSSVRVFAGVAIGNFYGRS